MKKAIITFTPLALVIITALIYQNKISVIFIIIAVIYAFVAQWVRSINEEFDEDYFLTETKNK